VGLRSLIHAIRYLLERDRRIAWSNFGRHRGPIAEPIRSAVDLRRDRVKPAYIAGAQAIWTVWSKETKSVTAEAQVFNVFNHFALINFSGAFSGTAIVPPRGLNIRLRTQF
jgi:outer membrane receptor for Fe3+-dicitrate